jgi:hypothetical protein
MTADIVEVAWAVASALEAIGADYSVEDSILKKLQWYRDGGETSSTQWRDVVSWFA